MNFPMLVLAVRITVVRHRYGSDMVQVCEKIVPVNAIQLVTQGLTTVAD